MKHFLILRIWTENKSLIYHHTEFTFQLIIFQPSFQINKGWRLRLDPKIFFKLSNFPSHQNFSTHTNFQLFHHIVPISTKLLILAQFQLNTAEIFSIRKIFPNFVNALLPFATYFVNTKNPHYNSHLPPPLPPVTRSLPSPPHGSSPPPRRTTPTSPPLPLTGARIACSRESLARRADAMSVALYARGGGVGCGAKAAAAARRPGRGGGGGRRRAAAVLLLLLALAYVAGLLVFVLAGGGGVGGRVEVGREVGVMTVSSLRRRSDAAEAAAQPGSVYRSHLVFERLWPDIRDDASSASAAASSLSSTSWRRSMVSEQSSPTSSCDSWLFLAFDFGFSRFLIVSCEKHFFLVFWFLCSCFFVRCNAME